MHSYFDESEVCEAQELPQLSEDAFLEEEDE